MPGDCAWLLEYTPTVVYLLVAQRLCVCDVSDHSQIETDHKLLVPLLGTTQLDSLLPRVLRFRLRLTRFDYSISHVPGEYLCTADTLSRAPIKTVKCVYEDDKDVETFVETQKDVPNCLTVIQ